jgi:hypothetical protein
VSHSRKGELVERLCNTLTLFQKEKSILPRRPPHPPNTRLKSSARDFALPPKIEAIFFCQPVFRFSRKPRRTTTRTRRGGDRPRVRWRAFKHVCWPGSLARPAERGFGFVRDLERGTLAQPCLRIRNQCLGYRGWRTRRCVCLRRAEDRFVPPGGPRGVSFPRQGCLHVRRATENT